VAGVVRCAKGGNRALAPSGRSSHRRLVIEAGHDASVKFTNNGARTRWSGGMKACGRDVSSP